MRDYKVLLVDDDPFILKTIAPALQRHEKCLVVTADNGQKAIDEMSNKDFDLVITDLVMGETDGIAVLKKAKELNPETMVIVLTGYGDMTSAIDALRFDADDYLLKPCELEEIFFRVGHCLERLECKKRIKLYEKMLPVCCMCKKIRDDAGREPGTGKWVEMENYIREKAEIDITSAYCPECFRKLKEEIESLPKIGQSH